MSNKVTEFVKRKMQEADKPPAEVAMPPQPELPPGKSERVLIGILAGQLYVNASIAGLMFNLPFLNGDESNRFVFQPWLCAGHKPQEYARNLISEQALEKNADTLVMVDHDMILHGHDSLMTLLDTPDYDIAGPLQLMGMRHDEQSTGAFAGPRVYPVAGMFDHTGPKGRQFVPMMPSGKPQEPVDLVGSGIIAIKRRVLEDPRMLLAPDMKPPAFFRNAYEPNGLRTRGLDIDFCVRARELGYRVMVNWKATSGHLKELDLYEVEVYAKNQFLLGLEAGKKECPDAVPMAGS